MSAKPRTRRPRTRCRSHQLWWAYAPTPSRNGFHVYVICTCGRPRDLDPAQWEQELLRRATHDTITTQKDY